MGCTYMYTVQRLRAKTVITLGVMGERELVSEHWNGTPEWRDDGCMMHGSTQHAHCIDGRGPIGLEILE